MDELLEKTIPIYRLAVLGAKGVGKTSIVNAFVNNTFDHMYEDTEPDIRRYIRTFDIQRRETNPTYIMFQIEDMYHDEVLT